MPLKPDPAGDVIRSAAEVRKLFPWLETDRLRGIPHLISPAWATDKSQFDPEHYAEVWKSIGFDSVTLLTVHHDGYYLYPSPLVRIQPERDFFGEQVASCRKRDIRVIAYYSLALNSLVGSEHPEWRVRDARDRVPLPDYSRFFHYHWLCVNSPYREFAIAQMKEICERYPVDALWLDILYYPPRLSESTVRNGEDTCFCEHCLQAYSRWYQGEHLIDAMGSSRHDAFRAESYRRFLIDLKRSISRVDRPIALTFNGAGREREPYYERLDELADWHCSEAHRKPVRGLYSRLFNSLEKPFEMMSCSEQVWSHNVSKPTPLLKLEAAAALACGGTYTLGINHAPDGRLLDGNLSRLPSWAEWCRRIRPDRRRCALASEAAVFARPRDVSSGRVSNLADVLLASHVLFSFQYDTAAMAGIKLWIFPDPEIPADLFSPIEQHIARGGAVLVNGPLSPRCSLLGLAGITVHEAPASDCHYLQACRPELQAGLLPDECVFYESAEASILTAFEGEVLASLVPPFAPKKNLTSIQLAPNFPLRDDLGRRTPGLVRRRIGKGSITFSALDLARRNNGNRCDPWPRLFLGNVLRMLLGGQALAFRGNASVEALVTEDERSVSLWLFNHAYSAVNFCDGEEEGLVLKDVDFVFAPARLNLAVLPPASTDVLHFTPEDGGYLIRVSKLGLCQEILFSKASGPAFGLVSAVGSRNAR